MVKHYLGVDYGEKRIGLAVADDDVRVARPLGIVEPGALSALDLVRDVIELRSITDIVIGLPRNLDGEDTIQTTSVRQFADRLETLGVAVTLQDEAGTSELAQTRHPGKRYIDAEAAAIILQDYLESQ